MSFHHPLAFWLGCAALTGGVLAHLPMFIHASHMGYQMVGMPMDTTMLIGMAVIPLGLLLAAYGLMPRLDALRRPLQSDSILQFHVADGVALNREHWKLVAVLVIALIVDVMKPATLGFVMPGVMQEYQIGKPVAGLLALVALTGTTVGSIVWGRLADVFGRRAAILLSALMFIGTAICGAMPMFEWNLAMCFLMGASAGGLLPIAFTLMAEMIPTVHRGWLLVALGGVGTSAGYLAAAGAASLLEPTYGWRVLWLLGLPTGALIIFLDRYIPESPRFLVQAGLEQEARRVLAQFSGKAIAETDATKTDPTKIGAVNTNATRKAVTIDLLRGDHAALTYGLGMCGIGWGLANFGFLLWLPVNLGTMGMDAATASALLARSAFIALPGIALVIWMYHRWSSIGTLIAFILLTVASLLAFFIMGMIGTSSTVALIIATAALLVSASGVIATLLPYAAEIYPVHLRATGSGVIAASSKFGGILGAGFGVLGLLGNLAISAILIAVPLLISAVMLMRAGVNTRGKRLEEIQDAIARLQ
ncbi:MAG: MFS transporter [Pseudomonadota bacterium]